MANASAPSEPPLALQDSAALGAVLFAGAVGNVLLGALVLKDGMLHRTPYYLLLDLCAADAARSAFGFPMAVVTRGQPWVHPWCRALTTLFCFHLAFVLLVTSVTRYLAIAHHSFYAKRVTPCVCVALVVTVWVLSGAATLPPLLDVNEHCSMGHASKRPGDALGLGLALVVMVGATHAVYAKTLCFVYGHRKMKPMQLVPAISHNWTFHGPGATGQAAANWIAGFGQGPTPPALVGVRRAPCDAARRLLVLNEFKTEKRIGKMFYMLTLAFLLLWAPACYTHVFARDAAMSHVFLTAAGWLTFLQAAASPLICFAFNKELRVRLRVQLRGCVPCCATTPTPTEPYCGI